MALCVCVYVVVAGMVQYIRGFVCRLQQTAGAGLQSPTSNLFRTRHPVPFRVRYCCGIVPGVLAAYEYDSYTEKKLFTGTYGFNSTP